MRELKFTEQDKGVKRIKLLLEPLLQERSVKDERIVSRSDMAGGEVNDPVIPGGCRHAVYCSQIHDNIHYI